MKIEEGNIITLDNQKEYICVSKKDYQGDSYIYLISNFKPLEIMFAKEIVEGDLVTIQKVGDQALKMELLKLFKPQEESTSN